MCQWRRRGKAYGIAADVGDYVTGGFFRSVSEKHIRLGVVFAIVGGIAVVGRHFGILRAGYLGTCGEILGDVWSGALIDKMWLKGCGWCAFENCEGSNNHYAHPFFHLPPYASHDQF